MKNLNWLMIFTILFWCGIGYLVFSWDTVTNLLINLFNMGV
jgi:hypothetical protein